MTENQFREFMDQMKYQNVLLEQMLAELKHVTVATAVTAGTNPFVKDERTQRNPGRGITGAP